MSPQSARKNPPPKPAELVGTPLPRAQRTSLDLSTSRSLQDFSRPALIITNRQRALRVDLLRIRRLVRAALPFCLEEHGPLEPVLAGLTEISASIVSTAAMSRVHVDFLGLEGPTDVITFPYGEIVVCAAIAGENTARYGSTLDDELALYVIHGLLHLNGFDDLTPAAARVMRNRQAKILNMARRSLG